MNYAQVITPDLDPYVYQDGKVLTDWYGWCLATVRSAFKLPPKGRTAWEAWEKYTQNKHTDRSFPIGVYFPIWFSGAGGAGHVAIALVNANGYINIWTSPWTHKPYFDSYSSIDRLATGYHVQYVGWSEDLAGAQVIAPIPEQAPTPVVPYVVEAIAPKQIVTNKQPTNKWGMNYADFEYMCNHPIATVDRGAIMTAVALVRHNNGYQYYKTDTNDPDGWNVLDCDDYTPPPPPVVAPPVVTRPSSASIGAPISAPSTEKYSLIKTLPYYISDKAAAEHRDKRGELPPGAYYVFNTLNGMLSLTKTPGQPQGTWINPHDNVEAPPPPPVKVETTADIVGSFKWLYSDHAGVEYKVLENLIVRDLVHGGPAIKIPVGHTIAIYGSFEKGGQTYLRPLTAMDEKGLYCYYGIHTTDIYTGAPHLDNEYLVTDKIQYGFEKFYDWLFTAWRSLFGKAK